jgi:hypothetical protein
MIDPYKFMSINFIKKEPLTGSMSGMRYRMIKTGEKNAEKLLVTIWPEPFCFEKTEESKKQFSEFPFTADGLLEAIGWLNDQYEAQIDVWKSADTMEIG